ncbi:isopentenyl transferase family protein [Mesorhizobium sp. ORM16]
MEGIAREYLEDARWQERDFPCERDAIYFG